MNHFTYWQPRPHSSSKIKWEKPPLQVTHSTSSKDTSTSWISSPWRSPLFSSFSPPPTSTNSSPVGTSSSAWSTNYPALRHCLCWEMPLIMLSLEIVSFLDRNHNFLDRNRKLLDRNRKFLDRNRKLIDRNRNFLEWNYKFQDRNRNFLGRNHNFSDINRKYLDRNPNFLDRNRKYLDRNPNFPDVVVFSIGIGQSYHSQDH